MNAVGAGESKRGRKSRRGHMGSCRRGRQGKIGRGTMHADPNMGGIARGLRVADVYYLQALSLGST